MKKIISFAAALALAGVQPCTTAFSAETSAADTTPNIHKGWFKITAQTPLDVTNGMFTFSYDPAKLKVESAEFGETLSKTLTVINDETPGKITFAFASASPVTAISETDEDFFAEIVVSAINGHEENMYELCSLSFDELVTTDKDGKSVDVSTDGIMLSQIFQWPGFILHNPVTDSDGKTVVSLSADVNPGITNGVLTVNYNPDELEYTGFETAELFKNALCEVYKAEPGTIKAAFVSDTLISETGDILKFSFNAKKSCSTKMTVTVNEMHNTLPDEYSVYLGKDYSQKCDLEIKIPDKNVTAPASEKFDINNDGAVSTMDIVSLIEAITGTVPASAESDVNEDGKTDSADLLELIKILKG